MKSKGFTLIELLAVIVILAIIALIATPIILNIIKDSKESSNQRSIELYGHAVENAVARYQLKEGKPATDVSDLTIEYNGSRVECETTVINGDGTVYLADCKVGGTSVDYTYGKEQEEVSVICTLASDSEKEAYEIGAKYTCSLDEDRTFYVLENDASSDDITLLMDRNYTDDEVPKTMAWCDLDGENSEDNKCNHHDGLDPYVEKIQSKFGSSVIVGIPSIEQILAVDGNNIDTYDDFLSEWLYVHLSGSFNSSFTCCYWTSTLFDSDSFGVWFVSDLGLAMNDLEYGEGLTGLRPIITISKSKLS